MRSALQSDNGEKQAEEQTEETGNQSNDPMQLEESEETVETEPDLSTHRFTKRKRLEKN